MSVSLNKIGDVLLCQGQTDAALERYQQGLEHREALLASDPGSAQARRDVSVSFDRIGDVLVRQGQTDAALERYQQGLEHREVLLARDPGSAEARRDVWVSYWKLAETDLENAEYHWRNAFEHLDHLEKTGCLDQVDSEFYETARRRAGPG